MNVGELQTALLPYPVRHRVIVIVESEEERNFDITSVDEITDSESGKVYVFLACAESNE